MHASDVALIVRWLLPLWALGWLVFPLTSGLFPTLPDRGLAAGRSLAIALLGLAAFWLAATHLVSLALTPIWFVAVPLLLALGWRKAEVRERARESLPALLFSDLVFLAAFGCFLWIRLRYPEVDNLEKPMDAMLMAGAMRAHFLPFENPWFAGTPFTNYYYFGPLTGGLLARLFATPIAYAYNLVQPLYCATFLSVLWSVCAGITRSPRWGLAAALMVGMGGHLEPLRQMVLAHQQGKPIWPVDWWSTSRVIDNGNTINEYPAFTLTIGDAHAHFYAFSWAVLVFALAWSLSSCESEKTRNWLALVYGLLLGAISIGNTWDAPLYGVLVLAAAYLAGRRAGDWSRANVMALVGALPLPILAAAPYFLRFKAQVSGAVFNPWIPPPISFLLFWGLWLLLAACALCWRSKDGENWTAPSFCRCLVGVGLVALAAPYVFYIRGAFGDGDLRHMDTVFKFGLQAWLLLGTGAACAAVIRLRAALAAWSWEGRTVAWIAAATVAALMSLAPVCVVWARSCDQAPRNYEGQAELSLDGLRFVPRDEQAAIEWLRTHAQPGETVAEALCGSVGEECGDYDPKFGRVSAFSGVPTLVGWPNHITYWGVDPLEKQRRANAMHEIYKPLHDFATPLSPDQVERVDLVERMAAIRELQPTYIFCGTSENAFGNWLPADLGPEFKIVFRGQGDPADPFALIPETRPAFILKYTPQPGFPR